MKGQRLYKIEKLCSETAIGALFARGASASSTFSALAYPLRAVWRVNDKRTAHCPQFLISVPKKKIRHAVDRVTLRRRIRESYRLSRDLIDRDKPVDIAFMYVADDLVPSSRILHSMHRILRKIDESLQ